MPDWSAEYRRQTPFKQMVGLYNMWQSLSPDTRDWIAGLFGGGKDDILDAPAERGRDPILDEIVSPDAGYIAKDSDGEYTQVGSIRYVDDDGNYINDDTGDSATEDMAGNQNVSSIWSQNNNDETTRTELFDPTGYWSIWL
jgi:hypothetical protein